MKSGFLNTRLSVLARKILVFLVPYSFIQKFLSVEFGLPSSLSYLTDALLVLSFVFYLLDNRDAARTAEGAYGPVLFAMGIFVAFSIFTSLVHLVPPLLYIWAVRNTCRFFLFFYLACKLFRSQEIFWLFDFLSKFVVVNAFIVAYQYIVLGLRMDYLNGLIGSYAGGNAVLNTIMCVVTIWHVAQYTSGQNLSVRSLTIPNVALIVTSALNETKIYFIELLVIAICCSFVSPQKKTYLRTVCFVIVLLVASILGLQLFYYLYPGFRGFLSPDFLTEYLFERSYNSSELLYVHGVPVMNRFSAFSIIDTFFLEDGIDWFLGLGFGACEHSSFGLLDTEFFRRFGETNYMGYSTSYLFLETGAIGLCLYLLVFVRTFLSSIRLRFVAHERKESLFCAALGSSAAVVALLFCAYNNCLRIETSGYLLFLMLAVPFILHQDVKGASHVEKTN